MKFLGLRLVVFLAFFQASQGIPWIGPTHTIDGLDGDKGWTPMPTERPRIDGGGDLKRDLAVAANTCGWVDGDLNCKEQALTAWVVVNIATCFWNSDLKLVNVWSTCIDNGQSLTSCNGDCAALVNTCPPASPYCGSIYFPYGYRGYGNCNPTPGVTHNVKLTYTGLDEPVDLPIFTGAKGISTGTQYPLGESPAATSLAGSSAPVSSPTFYSTTTATSSSSLSASSHSSTPVGAIVGGVVGGLALICATIVAIFWISRSKRKGTSPTVPMFQSPTDGKGEGLYQPRIHELEQPQQRPELDQTQRRSELQ